MKRILLIILTLAIGLSDGCFAQGTISRPGTKPTTTKTSKPKPKPTKPTKPQATVNVSSADGQLNGHGYVDLGLPSGTKWATCNIEATKPEGVGDFFSWGDTKPKSYYYENTTPSMSPPDGMIQNRHLTPAYDAARVNWGAMWRMPTETEVKELIDCCTWTWVINPAGMIITGPNGKTIFLSANDSMQRKFRDKGDVPIGHYWTSCDDNGGLNAVHLFFSPSRLDWIISARYYGFNIRPVFK